MFGLIPAVPADRLGQVYFEGGIPARYRCDRLRIAVPLAGTLKFGLHLGKSDSRLVPIDGLIGGSVMSHRRSCRIRQKQVVLVPTIVVHSFVTMRLILE